MGRSSKHRRGGKARLARGPWPEIDQAEWDYAGGYLRLLATWHLKLADWRLWVTDEPCEDDALASVWPTAGRKRAQVSLCRGWQKLSADEKRHTLTHELIHLLHRDQTDLIRLGLRESGYLPASAYDLMWEGFRLATEVMVDELADALAPAMPVYGSALPASIAPPTVVDAAAIDD